MAPALSPLPAPFARTPLTTEVPAYDLAAHRRAQRAVSDVRNRLMVFYSAAAWARSKQNVLWSEVVPATTDIERSTEVLRVALVPIATAFDASNDNDLEDHHRAVLPDAARSVGAFLHEAERPMGTLRRALAVCGAEGAELLADLEDTIVRVRYAAALLAASARAR